MLSFESLSPQEKDLWRLQLDRFAEENQRQLSALVWGWRQQENDPDLVFGVDLKPKPHFFSCSSSAIQRLNQQLNHQIQEILGILDNHDPTEEVVLLALQEGQIKLLYFQPNPSPPLCFEQQSLKVDELLHQLESKLAVLLSVET